MDYCIRRRFINGAQHGSIEGLIIQDEDHPDPFDFEYCSNSTTV